jgi:5-(carboxyamino)imidazole ribonucleotide synthase
MTTLGILGGGQLGRMLGLAAIPLGVRCRFLDHAADVSAAAVGEHIRGEFQDERTLACFADGLDVVTYEFENVPVAAAEWLARRLPVYPPPAALAASQERLEEKQFFQRLGVAVPPFAPAQTRAEFDAAINELGPRVVVKTRRHGYDGKGQRVIESRSQIEPAWQHLGGVPLIVEECVRFERELSIIAVRGRDGDVRFYPLVENAHRDGILRRSIAPAPDVSPALQRSAEEIARRTLESLDYVGVLAIELFEVGGRLLVNEMAPRVHNSGHWTIEGAQTSQFENHLRAVLGMPLGDSSPRGVAAMVNLIGTLPDVARVLRVPGVHLHLYGKSPRPGRKVGHITVCADSVQTLRERGEVIRPDVLDNSAIVDF